MTKNDLEKLRTLKIDIRSKELEIEELRSILEKITVDTTREAIQSSSNREDLLAKLVDMDVEYFEKVIDMYAKRKIAEEQIELMSIGLHPKSGERQKQYLTLRYINCMTNSDIAELMDKAERSIYRIKERAELNFDKLHKE